jgi:diacylglycerol kinase (ATP)
MQLIVIYNAQAGTGHLSREQVETLLREAGHQVEIIDRKGDKWRERLGNGADAVVAAGGDGTVHKVIHEMAGTDVPVAILPIGTANNVAHSLGYAFGDPLRDRIAQWPAKEQRIAIADVAREGWKGGFIEAVGVGAFADMVLDPNKGGTSDHTAMVLARVREALIKRLMVAPAMGIELEIDDEKVVGQYLMAEVLNLRFLGPRLLFVPHPSPDRATFTVCAIDESQREFAAHWIATGNGDPRRFELGRGRDIRMRTNAPMHVDGKGVEEEPTGEIRLEAGQRIARLWV